MNAASAPTTRRAFMWGRLGSFLAIVPLGVWTANHIWDNLKAFQGEKQWEAAVTGTPDPYFMAVTMVVVLLPLVLHTIWGVQKMIIWRPNNTRWGTFANLRFALQRLAAIGLALFLGAHLWLAFIQPRFVKGEPEAFRHIAHEMNEHFPTLIVYLLGTLGASYHLGNGLSTFLLKFGGAGKRATLRADVIGISFFVLLLAGSWAVIYALYTAGAVINAGGHH